MHLQDKHLRLLARWLICLVCMPGLLSETLQAQQASGSVVGTITDDAGAVVPNAMVALTNVETGDQRKASTNGSGDYQFVNLAPGNYKVDIEVQGFKHFTRLNVVVQVQGSTRVDAALQVGDVNQTVEVSSTPPLLETQHATVGQVVAGRAVNELPLNGRNILNLLRAVGRGCAPRFHTGGKRRGGNARQ